MKGTCQECKSKEKRLKVMQSDTDFELKKMTEDLAQEKVLLEMQYQKEHKKLMDKYCKEKHQREQENKKWLNKYDSMVLSYQKTIEELHHQSQLTQKNIKESLLHDYQRKEEEVKDTYLNQMATLKKEHQHIVFNLKETQNKEIRLLQKHQEEAIGNLKQSHGVKIEAMRSQYEKKVSKLRKQIEEVATNRDTLKKEACQKQTSLYQQIYERKQEISSLKYQIDHLNITIKDYEEQIRFKNHEIDILKEKHEETLDNYQRNFQSEKTKIISNFNSKIEELLVNKLNDCQMFEETVKKIQEKRETQLKINEVHLKEVQEMVEQRPSKNQDIEQINNLKEMLNQKEREIEKMMSEMKCYKLELNYKESTFNRIFPSNQNILNLDKAPNKKKENNKGSRSSVSLLKDQAKLYNTIHSIAKTSCDFRKEKLHIQAKSSKIV